MMEKYIISKKKILIIFWKKKNHFVNVETDPRLQYKYIRKSTLKKSNVLYIQFLSLRILRVKGTKGWKVIFI